MAIAAAVILGSLITWLQTKLDINVSRKDGKTEFHIRAQKEAAGKELIAQTAKQVGHLLLL